MNCTRLYLLMNHTLSQFTLATVRRRAAAVPFWSLFLLLLVACPGEMEPMSSPASHTTPDAGPGSSTPSPDSWPSPDQGPASNSKQDSAMGDGGSAAAPDSLPAPDQQPPDASPFADVVPAPGGSCPCGTYQVCVASKCRTMCKPPTDPCKAVTSLCGTGEACVPTDIKGLNVCMPGGKGPGQLCKGSFCQNGYVCGSVNKGLSFHCLPVCKLKGAFCGTGGKCVATSSGCMFCTKP